MLTRLLVHSRTIAASAAALVLASAPAPSQTPGPEEYRVLDNIEGDNVDLVFAPVNPMVLSPDGAQLYAVNTHGSTLQRFTGLTTTPTKTYAVPWGPVSVAYWVAPDGHHELLVVSRGTYTLVGIDPTTGAFVRQMKLPAEPGGILLDATRNHLFVACSADDVVVEIDLVTGSEHDRFEIDSGRHVLFLSKDGSNVLVTPMLSGNNTLADDGFIPTQADHAKPVLDMSDPAVATAGLPDDDVHRLIPGVAIGSGMQEVVAHGVGTNLFAHGINPATGKLWTLHTQAFNAGAASKGAPGLKNRFTRARVATTTLPAVGGPAATTHAYFALDDISPSTFVAGQNVAKPYALAFDSAGRGFVTGASTDNVRVIRSTGVTLATWALDPGAIPRGVVLQESQSRAYVYCWGTNEIDVRSTVALAGTQLAKLDLGYDPADADVREGREIFFDAHRSKFENATCETCHPDGLFDFLMWDNSPLPHDDKGPMFTMSLRGIADKRPYHWRGEQLDLEAFNDVFVDLFDKTKLSTGAGSEFEKLQEYIFQLENPANPNAVPDRTISDDQSLTKFAPPDYLPADLVGASAQNGQHVYFDLGSVGAATCQTCHTLPTGTSSDLFEDGFRDQHHRSAFDATAYNGMWRKEQQKRVDVQFVGGSGTERRPPLGSGTGHAGLEEGVFEFVFDLFPQLTDDEREDCAFFLHQIDSGLAPAVHDAYLLGPATLGAQTQIGGYLTSQFSARNCDVAVIGQVDIGGVARTLRWYLQRRQVMSATPYVCEDPSVPNKDLAFFVTQAGLGHANLFLGLPVGMGQRWAVDYDADGLFNVPEIAATTSPFDPDFDVDGFLDGTEVALGSNPKLAASLPNDTTAPTIATLGTRLVYKTARIAKIIVVTSEPTRLEVDYDDGIAPPRQVDSAGWKRLHTVLLRDLEPSYVAVLDPIPTPSYQRTYNVTIQAFDQANNASTTLTLPAFDTEPFITAFEGSDATTPVPLIPKENVVADLVSFTPTALGGGGYHFKYEATIVNFKAVPAQLLADHVAVARVIVNGVRVGNFVANGSSTPPTSLSFPQLLGFQFPPTIPPVPPLYLYLPSPYLLGSISGTNGISTLEFDLPSAGTGDIVEIAIETVGEVNPATFNPTAAIPAFTGKSLFEFPTTPAAARKSAPITLP